jgi:hypothetical protein
MAFFPPVKHHTYKCQTQIYNGVIKYQYQGLSGIETRIYSSQASIKPIVIHFYMIDLIRFPTISYAYRELLTYGDGDDDMVMGIVMVTILVIMTMKSPSSAWRKREGDQYDPEPLVLMMMALWIMKITVPLG